MKDVPIILVVDDESVNLTILSWILDEAGFDVLTASSGPEARELAAKRQPTLILLDILMPGEDGYSVCRSLKQAAATQNTPVIFISGLSGEADKARAMTLGAADFIMKPFSRQEILERVRLHVPSSMAMPHTP
ncbi:MAG: response regulator [Desulfovibrionaceae bacterium]|nr:MAG: response regulator [Desulfovibrionaceae bacterium]